MSKIRIKDFINIVGTFDAENSLRGVLFRFRMRELCGNTYEVSIDPIKKDCYIKVDDFTTYHILPEWYDVINDSEKCVNIEVPEGYEIDKEKSTFECIKFKLKESYTYKDIAKNLFKNRDYVYCINEAGNITNYNIDTFIDVTNPNNCISRKQCQKLLAINKLMNVATYLNDSWKPNWNDITCKYYFRIPSTGKIEVDTTCTLNISFTYFKTRELAEQAIKILGVDTIKLALSTDY